MCVHHQHHLFYDALPNLLTYQGKPNISYEHLILLVLQLINNNMSIQNRDIKNCLSSNLILFLTHENQKKSQNEKLKMSW